jgi:uncharacterized protein (UPF0332 family)
LNKLKRENYLELIEPSEEISKSYLIKSDKCIEVAKLAYNAKIYENAISEAYYSIYNSVLSLFFKCGIKCKNHSASVLLIENLFQLDKLYPIFSDFKKDRIDNQYYVSTTQTEPINKEKCNEKIKIAKEFNIRLKTYSINLNLEKINDIRKRFNDI